MKKRVAETLIEVVTAMTLFGIIMSGIFDFMGGQANYITQLNYYNKAAYGMQKFVNGGNWTSTVEDTSLGVKFRYDSDTILVEQINADSSPVKTPAFSFKLK